MPNMLPFRAATTVITLFCNATRLCQQHILRMSTTLQYAPQKCQCITKSRALSRSSVAVCQTITFTTAKKLHSSQQHTPMYLYHKISTLLSQPHSSNICQIPFKSRYAFQPEPLRESTRKLSQATGMWLRCGEYFLTAWDDDVNKSPRVYNFAVTQNDMHLSGNGRHRSKAKGILFILIDFRDLIPSYVRDFTSPHKRLDVLLTTLCVEDCFVFVVI